MPKTNYTLNLGQLIKITPDQNKYLWQKLKADKPQNHNWSVNEKISMFIVPNINIIAIVIDNHMVIIQV